MRLLVLVASLVLLPGCFIRNARMEAKLKPWVGKPITAAVSEFGPPSEVWPNGDTSIIGWSYSGPSYGVVNRNRFGGTVTSYGTSCRMWFDVDANGIITGWHWKGQC